MYMKIKGILLICLINIAMNLGQLLHSCEEHTKNKFRSFEKINKKVINNNWSILFNEVCIKEYTLA